MEIVDEHGQPLLCADVEIIEGVNLVQEETKQKRGGKKSGPHVKTYIVNKDHRRTKYNKGCKQLISKVKNDS